MKLDSINKSLISSVALSLFYHTSQALTIENYNTQEVIVEVMDCTTHHKYGYPSKWFLSCNAISSNFCVVPNRLYRVDFLNLSHLKPNEQMTLNPEANSKMPNIVCVHVEGSSNGVVFETGVVNQEVTSTCAMKIYDNGYTQGVTAEYSADCF